ncbi:translation initiation factor IF-2 [Streptomyces sp. ODS28]|uniref:class I SAM-dependent methyltransferase n=1 Tax=Streptomyces sp. ODS28 TaxID=3136688 RepID=UPI0031F17B06
MRTTGAVAPSGAALARALSAPLRASPHRPPDGPLTVLEAGAGTGAVTGTLLDLLPPGGSLDVAEANPRFAERLRALVDEHPRWSEAGDGVRVHARLVEEMPVDHDHGHGYDVIVSGLPFANFAPAEVEVIMGRYLELLRPGGTLTYFAYLGTRRARALLASGEELRRHHAVEEVLAGYRERYATGFRNVWPNLPPARVWELRRPAAGVPLTPCAVGAAR